MVSIAKSSFLMKGQRRRQISVQQQLEIIYYVHSIYLHIYISWALYRLLYMFRLILCIFTAAVAPVQSNKAFARQTDGRLFESQPQQTSNVDKNRNSALMYKQFLYVFLLQTKLWIKKFIFISMMQNTKQVCEGNLETGK